MFHTDMSHILEPELDQSKFNRQTPSSRDVSHRHVSHIESEFDQGHLNRQAQSRRVSHFPRGPPQEALGSKVNLSKVNLMVEPGCQRSTWWSNQDVKGQLDGPTKGCQRSTWWSNQDVKGQLDGPTKGTKGQLDGPTKGTKGQLDGPTN